MSQIPVIDLTDSPVRHAPYIQHGRVTRSEVIQTCKKIGEALELENPSQKEVFEATLEYIQETKENDTLAEEHMELMKSQLEIANARIRELEEQLAAAARARTESAIFSEHPSWSYCQLDIREVMIDRGSVSQTRVKDEVEEEEKRQKNQENTIC